MNLFKIHTNKGVKEIAVADCWEPNPKSDPPKTNQCTTAQYQKLAVDWDGEDLVKLFSILSGMEYKALANTHDFILEEQLLAATRFIYNDFQDFKEASPPHWIEINGKQIRIPKQIGALSIGQSIHVRQALDKLKVYEELIAFVVAIYLQPLYDGTEFDFHRAMELEQDVLKLPIAKTYPLGIFFLKRLTKPGVNIMSKLSFSITRLLQVLSKSERA